MKLPNRLPLAIILWHFRGIGRQRVHHQDGALVGCRSGRVEQSGSIDMTDRNDPLGSRSRHDVVPEEGLNEPDAERLRTEQHPGRTAANADHLQADGRRSEVRAGGDHRVSAGQTREHVTGATEVAEGKKRFPWWLLLLLLLAVLALVLYFALRDNDNGDDAAPNSAPASSQPVPAGQEAVTQKQVPVYWLSKAGPKLFRSYTEINGQPTLEAVRAMSSQSAPDADYTTAWGGAEPTSVVRNDGVITVDFSQLPQAQLKDPTATAAVQELVYTVQSAMNATDPVRVTKAGQAVPTMFGAADTSVPVQRMSAAEVQNKVWITEPTDKSTVSGPVKVSGTAWSKGQLNWRAVNTADRSEKTGTVQPGGSSPNSPYTFNADLPAGNWTLEVFDPAGSQAQRTLDSDSKTFTVR